MNVNEEVANRAHVINGGKLVKKKLLFNLNDVNKSQSSNDIFSNGTHIAYKKEHTIPR